MGIRAKASVTAPQTSLSAALFSNTQQRVLAFLFGQPERSFFATELIGLAGGGSGAVQRELKGLAESGLVTVTRLGNQKHYQANPQSPIFAELCGIVQKTVGLAEPLRAALMPFAKGIYTAQSSAWRLMDYLPIFVDVRNKLCLVVGGGEVAKRKASVLLEAGAKVRVVAPEIDSGLMKQRGIEPVAARFEAAHLDGATLVIAATNDHSVNRQISGLARARNIPVNVVDDPSLCSFIMPAILDRSPLMVAFSSGGASPVLTRMLRGKLETVIPQNFSRLAAFAERFRNIVKQRVTNPAKRRIFWENVFEGVVAEKVLTGHEASAEAMLQQMLANEDNIQRGEVYLVGAGPGDPDLLTFRALRLMQKADVVVYDNLVSKPIVEMTRRDAERIFVGKKRADHTLAQEEINELLVRLAKEGKRVLRLKGGDPFIFGRGGEEIETLAAEGIAFQVVPGITAASGVASYAGIPLTHRDHAQSCVFVTGHLKDGTMNLDWDALARPKQTVVVYMGLHGLDVLCAELIKHGMPDTMPIAIVQQGTTQNQRVITGTLATLPGIAEREQLQAPTLIIVGGVVTLREKLAWFHPQKS